MILRTSSISPADKLVNSKPRQQIHRWQGNERLKNPSQKPLKVLKHLIKIASEPGNLVLDPFMGVASAGEAALEAKRIFCGIEIDEKYWYSLSLPTMKLTSDPTIFLL